MGQLLVLSNMPLSAAGGMAGRTRISLRPVHPLKAPFPMAVTDVGMVKVVRPMQFSKALRPMAVNCSGKEISVKALQFRKALFSIVDSFPGRGRPSGRCIP